MASENPFLVQVHHPVKQWEYVVITQPTDTTQPTDDVKVQVHSHKGDWNNDDDHHQHGKIPISHLCGNIYRIADWGQHRCDLWRTMKIPGEKDSIYVSVAGVPMRWLRKSNQTDYDEKNGWSV